MVEIAVLGAGAAGLVSARHLLLRGLSASLFDSRSFLGGAWSAAAASNNKSQKQQKQHENDATSSSSRRRRPQMWDTLTPNLSKFTCRFSDLNWPESTPTFPSLADMNAYLEDYAEKYVIHNEKCTLHYGCTVTCVQRCNTNNDNAEEANSNSEKSSYKVEWQHTDGSMHSKIYDGVVVATGFFSTPVYPDGMDSASNLIDTNDNNNNFKHKIIHSCDYRSPDDFANSTVAVIGGSFSGTEIASDVRRRAKHVVSIVGNVPYVLPRHVIPNNNDAVVVPLDYVLYQRREDAPKIPEQILLIDVKDIRQRHEVLQNLVGARKRAQLLSKGLFPTDTTLPPAVAISDDYANLVLDDKIQVVRGRVARITPSSATDNSGFCIELQDGTTLPSGNYKELSTIDCIICCTGYRTCLADFLSSEILATLEYDETDMFAPLTLCFDAFHPKLPRLGFVGMYKGPYFGYMELQARLLAQQFAASTGIVDTVSPLLSEREIEEALQNSRDIRRQQTTKEQHVAPRQFPHFDYIGMMDSLADKLNLVPDPSTFGRKGMMVSPAFYQTNPDISRECQKELEALVGTTTTTTTKQHHGGGSGATTKIPKAALSALVGNWSFERTIYDKLSGSTQRVHGKIAYSLQEPNFDTLRYREDGFLDLPNGNQLEVFREYDYLQKDGALEMYFVESGERAHLFLSLKFEEQQHDGYWMATSDHLCIKDLYKGTFKIAFDGIGASAVSMTYRVKGPNKDYESVTHLRPLP